MDSIQKIINNIILNFSALSEALQAQETRTNSRLDYHENALDEHESKLIYQYDEIEKHKNVLKSIAETINNNLD
jgi:hypothetical protein